MAQRYNTGNQRPSNSMKDLNDNTLAYDDFLNGEQEVAYDRFQKPFPTVRRQVAERIDEITGAQKSIEQYAVEAKQSADNAQNIADANTYYVTPEDPDGTIAGLAGTPDGKGFRVAIPDADGLTVAFNNYKNNGGVAEFINSEPNKRYVDEVSNNLTSRLYLDTLPGVKFASLLDDDSVVFYGDDLGVTTVPNLSLRDGYDISYEVVDLPFVMHVETDQYGFPIRWIDDLGVSHDVSTLPLLNNNQNIDDKKISPQVYDTNEVQEIGYNQWINNVAVKAGKDYFFGSVRLGTLTPSRTLGNLAISRRQGERGRFGTYEFGPRAVVNSSLSSSDDHDAPSILLDTRPTAVKPIMAFQSDHSGAASWLRCWTSPTIDPANIGEPVRISTQGNMTYAQTYRNPKNQDEIAVFARNGNSNSAKWFVHISQDNGATWARNAFIGGDDLYMTSCQSQDGDSIHIAIQNHPRSTDTRVIYLQMVWATKELVNISGVVFAANILTYQFTNPFLSEVPDVVFTAAVDNTKRLFEIKQTATAILFLVAEFNEPATTYKRMKMVKWAAGALTIFDIADCGIPMSNDGTLYVAGGCIISDTSVLVCSWSGELTTGKISKYDYDGSVWNESQIETATNGDKICRPLLFKSFYQDSGVLSYADTETVIYQRGTYNGYVSFDMNAKIINIGDY
ncbi:flagellar biosynthesis protein [Serratia proteamaculans]|uniref:flagellar biosynthesis protein n=1 Tax=Serratia proteamaculans TaxID=28151 RepID=UPI0010209C6F|nr:flagellar biosynthesis protein [Serratia proteamaculans]RYM50029.1 hypothetical protein BSQ96_18550 [Serratia proteamaculans]